MLDRQRIREIRERCSKATPGPWTHDGMHDEVHGGSEYWVLDEGELPDHPDAKPIDEFGHRVNPNYVFAAHAREDIPALLGALEETETDRDHWKAERDRWKKQADKYEDRLVISPYGDDKIDELEDAMEYAKADRDQWKLLAEQNLKTAELALAESDRWKARAEALEMAIRKLAGDADSYGSLLYEVKCATCANSQDCAMDDAPTEPCGDWMFDEARFTSEKGAAT